MTTQLADSEQTTALAALTELLSCHFAEAIESADDTGKFSIGFRLHFDRSNTPTKLKVISRISKTFTDEIETLVPDPNQPNLL